MPEGDSVLVAATRLHRALAGSRIERSDFRVPRLATADLAGQTIREVVPRGKHLLFRTDAGQTVHTHFRMDGTWHLYRRGERWRGGPDHEVRVVLETATRAAVGYRLPVVDLLPTEREGEVVGHLGPDVLGPDWDPAEAVRRLLERPEREVGAAIVDQRVMAGPGNVYKCEALFLRGVDPWTRLGELEDPRALVELIARLMEANRATGMQITTGDTRPGRTHWVHGRARQPCLRCGTAIGRRMQHDVAGGEDGELDRVTFWCPTCQPAGRPAAPT